MNERTLTCFLKVYQLGSIHKAAEAMYLSAQAVSKTIGKLEEEIGEQLFVRDKDGMYPTPCADKLKVRAEAIIYQYDLIRQDVTKHDSDSVVVLRIASTYAVLKYLSVDFLEGFYDKHPNIHLNFVEYPEAPIYEMLKKGQLDLAFLPDPVDVNLCKFVFCFSHGYRAVMNKEHPLAKKKVLEYKDLNGIPLALKGREYSVFPININRFVKGGLTPDIQIETSDDSLIVEAARRNWCVGITADYLAKEYCDETMAIIPFADKDYVRNIYLSWRRDIKPSPATQVFIDFTTQWCSNINEK